MPTGNCIAKLISEHEDSNVEHAHISYESAGRMA